MISGDTLSTLLRTAADHLATRDYPGAHKACMRVLRIDPQAHEALYLLGILTADHHNHGKAIELYERAIAIDPLDGRYHAWRGRSLLALNQREAAISAAETAAACSGLTAHTNNTIGVIFSRAGLHDRATAFYQDATNAEPNRPDYWYNLGAAEQFRGRFDEARTALRETITLSPNHTKAWSALIQITKQSDQDTDLSTLVALFPTLTETDDKLNIGHAIAKAYEDLGKPDDAMTWLSKAKAAKKLEIGYQIDHDRHLFAAASRTASQDASAGWPDAAPIFIVGLPRTGTTLVDRILSSHTQVQSAGELTDFALSLKRAVDTPSRYVLDAETLDAAAEIDLTGVGQAYIASARRIVPDAPRFIDKMPLNFLCAALITKALPQARIICLRRHPGDSVLSNYRQLFATEFSYYNYAFDLADTAEYFAEFDALIAKLRDQLPPDQFTEVAYEDIVFDLDSQARRLVAFCDLEWEPACLSFHENAAPVATASSAQVRQPLYSGSIGRWKRYREHIEPAIEVLAKHGLLDPSEV